MMNNISKNELAIALNQIGALKFGDFTLKSGIESPMYIDLRLLISHPALMKQVAKVYSEMIKDIHFDRLAGVAYAALPIAGAISLEMERPWIFLRKEAAVKAYGLQKALEGEWYEQEEILVIEDLTTKGTSLLEVVSALQSFDLRISDAAVLLDYNKGGEIALQEAGVNLHHFATIREMVDVMLELGKIDAAHHARCIEFVET
jgi:uridine monophosphate synthetase